MLSYFLPVIFWLWCQRMAKGHRATATTMSMIKNRANTAPILLPIEIETGILQFDVEASTHSRSGVTVLFWYITKHIL